MSEARAKPLRLIGDPSDLWDHLSGPLAMEAEAALRMMICAAEREAGHHGLMLSDGRHDVYAYSTAIGVCYGLNAPHGNVWRRMRFNVFPALKDGDFLSRRAT